LGEVILKNTRKKRKKARYLLMVPFVSAYFSSQKKEKSPIPADS